MSYLVDVLKVGVNVFLIFKLVTFDKILVSTSSIKPVSFECLKIVSNFCNVFKL